MAEQLLVRLRCAAGRAEPLTAAVPAGAGAIVMATGIVSIGLSIDREHVLSYALLALAGLVWLLLASSAVLVGLRRRPLLLEHASSAAALTAIAGTDVVGAGLARLGWDREAAALLALAALVWVLLVPYVLAHWRRPTTGGSFVLTVATESLAVLAASLAIHFRASWLALAAAGFLVVGLGFYVFVVSAFDLRQLLTGGGDQWVSGGALAIAALACARTAQATGAFDSLGTVASTLSTAALGIWAAAVVWLPALLLGEVAARRAGLGDLRRWSTVFPLGMYATCSFAVSDVDGAGGLGSFARVWIWVALAAWLPVFAGMLRRAAEVAREGLHDPAGERG